MTIQSIEANLSNLVYVCNEIKKREKEGSLPADGKITVLTDQQAQEMLTELNNSSDKPDSSNLGYAKHIFFRVLKDLGLDKQALKKSLAKMIDKGFVRGMPNMMNTFTDTFTPNQAIEFIVVKIIKPKVLPQFYILKNIQTALQSSINATYEHSGQCGRFEASKSLTIQATKEVIGAITYKTPVTNPPSSLATNILKKVHFQPSHRKEQLIPREFNKSDLSELSRSGGRHLLKSVQREIPTEGLAKGRFYAVRIFASPPIASNKDNLPNAICLSSLENANEIEEAAQKVVDLAGDLTGINFAVEKTKEIEQMFVTMISDLGHAPKLLVQQLLKEPEKIFQKALKSPKEFINSAEAFTADPTLMSALEVVGAAFSTVSLANEILPILTRVSQKVIKDPFTAPQIVTKEMLNLTINKAKGIWTLTKGLATDPIGSGKDFIKGVIHTPDTLVRNVKNFFSKGKRKQRRQMREAQEQEMLQAAKQAKIAKEQINLKRAIEKAIPSCYKAAVNQWMVKHDKPINDYFLDMLKDWKNATSHGLFNGDVAQFAIDLMRLLKSGRLSDVAHLSPCAHLSEPTPPPKVAFALAGLAQETLKLVSNRKELENATVDHNEEAAELKDGIDGLARANQAYEVSHQTFASTSQSFFAAHEDYAQANDLTEINSKLKAILADSNKLQALRARIKNATE